MTMVGFPQYVKWILRVVTRGLLSPFRQLGQGGGGVGLLVLTMVFIMLFTLHGVRRTQLEYEDDSWGGGGIEMHHQKMHIVKGIEKEVMEELVDEVEDAKTTTVRTPRDPDRLTFKFIEKIYAHLSDDEQVSLAYELHVKPENLLVQRQTPAIKQSYVKRNRNETSSESILCVKSPHANMRLGNLLFMYASTYSLAKNTQHILTADTEFDSLKAVFDLIQYVHRYVGNEIGAIMPRYHAKYEVLHLPPTDVCLSGYLQSWRYFYAYEDDLRQQLRFPEDTRRKIDEELLKLVEPVADRQGVMPKDITKVCVHVRRGDMLDRLSSKQGFQIPDPSYYYKAMLYFYILYPHAHFIIVSDDPEWCQAQFADLHRAVTLTSSGDPAHDLATLSACDHVIGSVGTYSWWGGWLAGGRVVLYSSPVRPESEMAEGFHIDDYVPPKWALMDDKA